MNFEYKRPEETGISSKWIINFLNRIEQCQLPLHSFILMKDDAIIAETYYAPYTATTNHRMFSITKSFVSVAIGLLSDDGKLSLDDKIVSYFPEKLPEGPISPYLAELTIRDMLRMASCYHGTTYNKLDGNSDWTGSFFNATPEHVPGATFAYDTSATHTLCTLVEKITGMRLLDFLKQRFLDEAGFSKNSYIMPNSGGETMGGSGLMCTPMDLLKFIYIIAHDGRLNDKQVISEEYVRAATSRQIDTMGRTATWEDMQGYGYQFWCTTRKGFSCFGMGGQYGVYFSDYNLFFITTSDVQGRSGGTQLIYDTFYQEILDKIGVEEIINGEITHSDYEEFLNSRSLFHIPGSNTSSLLDTINNRKYILDESSTGFKWIKLSIAGDCGTLNYSNASGEFTLGFGIGHNEIVTFPDYNFKSAVSGAFRDDNTFLIKAQIIDEAIGNIIIQLCFNDDDITIMLRKIEETMFSEFDGILSGHAE